MMINSFFHIFFIFLFKSFHFSNILFYCIFPAVLLFTQTRIILSYKIYSHSVILIDFLLLPPFKPSFFKFPFLQLISFILPHLVQRLILLITFPKRNCFLYPVWYIFRWHLITTITLLESP